jgi:transposase
MSNIHKSPLSRRDRTALERRRLKATKLFLKGHSQAEVARKLKVTREASRQWYDTWQQKGKDGLKSIGKPGPKPQLTPEKLKLVEKALLRGPNAYGFKTQIWTLGRIASVIKRVARVSHHPGHIWYVLKSMNWSCQKPETKAAERDEQEVIRWKKIT